MKYKKSVLSCQILTITLFVAVAGWFWTFLSHGTLYFLETTQFFPFTFTHFKESLGYPGGLGQYISEFFVQFFIFAAVAGLIVTIFLVLIQALTWKAMKEISGKDGIILYPISFIPAFCGWAYLCVFGNMFTAIVALSAALVAFIATTGSGRRNIPKEIIVCILLYWAIGPIAVVYPLLLVMESIGKGTWKLVLASIGEVILMGLMPFIWKLFIHYPLRQLILGVDYFNEPGKCNYLLFLLAASPLVAAILAMILPGTVRNGKVQWLSFACIVVVVFAGGWFFMTRNCSPLNERVYEYYKLCYDRDWDGVIRKANKLTPVSISENAAINLALAKQGKLLDEMFNYPQPGFNALFPDYAQGYVISLTAGEAVYHAGLLNTARHYAFEEYESYPNYHVGAKHMKRLAEIDLINGNYRIARRYLKDLSHTLFYRKWALRFLKDPDSVAEVPEYAMLRQCRDTSDYLYNDSSDDDKRLILRRLVEKNGKRSIYSDYLMAYDLLSCDFYSFKQDYQLIDFGEKVPEYVKEGLVICCKNMLDGTPSSILDKDALDTYNNFQIALLERKPSGWLKKNFGNTLYYYFASKVQG